MYWTLLDKKKYQYFKIIILTVLRDFIELLFLRNYLLLEIDKDKMSRGLQHVKKVPIIAIFFYFFKHELMLLF